MEPSTIPFRHRKDGGNLIEHSAFFVAPRVQGPSTSYSAAIHRPRSRVMGAARGEAEAAQQRPRISPNTPYLVPVSTVPTRREGGTFGLLSSCCPSCLARRRIEKKNGYRGRPKAFGRRATYRIKIQQSRHSCPKAQAGARGTDRAAMPVQEPQFNLPQTRFIMPNPAAKHRRPTLRRRCSRRCCSCPLLVMGQASRITTTRTAGLCTRASREGGVGVL